MVKQAKKAVKVKKQSFFKDTTIVGDPVKYYVILSLVLFAFWLLLSGKLEAKFIIYGVATSLIAAYISMPLVLCCAIVYCIILFSHIRFYGFLL